MTSALARQKFSGTEMSNDQAKQTNNKTTWNVRKYVDVPSYILFLHIFLCSSKLEFLEFLKTCLDQFDVITEMPTRICFFFLKSLTFFACCGILREGLYSGNFKIIVAFFLWVFLLK